MVLKINGIYLHIYVLLMIDKIMIHKIYVTLTK